MPTESRIFEVLHSRRKVIFADRLERSIYLDQRFPHPVSLRSTNPTLGRRDTNYYISLWTLVRVSRLPLTFRLNGNTIQMRYEKVIERLV